MLRTEAEKIKTKYQFLVGHNFCINGMDVEIEDIYTGQKYEENCEDFEVYIVYKTADGKHALDKLSDFLRNAGSLFWVRYFAHLKRYKTDLALAD